MLLNKSMVSLENPENQNSKITENASEART